MEIYIMRHGETDYNAKGLIQGSNDIPLNAKGIALTKESAEGMKEAGIKFDRIISSPLSRAKETADIIGAAYGITPETDDRLVEMCFGSYEGQPITEVMEKNQNIYNLFKKPTAFEAEEGMESFLKLELRIRDFIKDKIYALGPEHEESVLIVCHGAVARMFYMVIRDVHLGNFWTIKQPNCCVNHFRSVFNRMQLLEGDMLFYDYDEDEDNLALKGGII